MSIYNWIQKVFFEIYEEWHMKDPAYDRNGFHISGIDNALKAMHDGYYTYAEISPSHAIKGCTSMKAVVGKSKEDFEKARELAKVILHRIAVIEEM